MGDFKSIEDKLNRLVPSTVSGEGQMEMEDAIDQLANASFDAEDTVAPQVVSKGMATSLWKAAAVIALLVLPAVMFVWKPHQLDSSVAVSTRGTDPVSERWDSSQLVVLKTTNRVDGLEIDGLILPPDGGAPHYRYRYQIIDEERVRDEKTGTVITLRQPRQEVVTIPVTQF